jgi:hypothetical protein
MLKALELSAPYEITRGRNTANRLSKAGLKRVCEFFYIDQSYHFFLLLALPITLNNGMATRPSLR